jgi:hypothetical protein
MTREEFIKVLKEKGYPYRIEEDKVVVTHRRLLKGKGENAYLEGANVHLDRLTSLPPGVEFRNTGYVWLRSIKSLPSGVIFNNDQDVYLDSLTNLPPDVKFNNLGNIELDSLTNLPPGVEFRTEKNVYLESLIGGWFDGWEGNIEGIEGIGEKRLLNKMISLGIFDKER